MRVVRANRDPLVLLAKLVCQLGDPEVAASLLQASARECLMASMRCRRWQHLQSAQIEQQQPPVWPTAAPTSCMAAGPDFLPEAMQEALLRVCAHYQWPAAFCPVLGQLIATQPVPWTSWSGLPQVTLLRTALSTGKLT